MSDDNSPEDQNKARSEIQKLFDMIDQRKDEADLLVAYNKRDTNNARRIARDYPELLAEFFPNRPKRGPKPKGEEPTSEDSAAED